MLINCMTLTAIYFAILANVNFSLISMIFAATPFITALLFSICFNESMNKAHYIGMTFLTLSLMVLS